MGIENNMRIYKLLVLLVIGVFIYDAHADTHAAASCSYADVSTAITAATAGDTVTVPSGSCSWATQLSITKGINLIGAGNGVDYGTGTVITSTYNGGNSSYSRPAYFAVVYNPTNENRNTGFRLSGFEFNFSATAHGIGIFNETTNYWENPVTNVRLDHNILKNARSEWVVILGPVHGVADNNIIDHTSGPTSDGIHHFGSSGSVSDGTYGNVIWHYMTFSFGSSANFYWEDNTYKTGSGYLGDHFDSEGGGRYVARFNTFIGTGTSAGSPLFNLHGSSDNRTSSMGTEIYRNTITTGSGTTYILQQRGGMAVVFDNVLNRSGTSAGLIHGGDYADACTADQNTNGISDACDNEWPYPNSPNGQPQYPSSSYYWNNSVTAEPNVLRFNLECTSDYSNSGGGSHNCPILNPPNRVVPLANVEYWGWYNETFTGVRGVGRGTKAQMNAITTCTQGVGYWVTNEGSWNQSGSGEQGRLYRCGSSNNWELFYEPYTYPHPLRSGGIIISAPTSLRIL